jgi:protoporphyrinogen oxidase
MTPKHPAQNTTTPVEVDVLIIGGGPTGLGAALHLEKAAANWTLLEANDYLGGLSASFVDDKGFTWDLGGHVQFSHYASFDRYMELALGKNEWLNHQRESWIWIKNRFVPYPFQNNLHRLDPDDRWACISGLLDAASQRHPVAANFEDWMESSMGSGITNLFLRPYNSKVWAYPLPMLDFNWIGERVSIPDLRTVLKSICTGEDNVSWGPNKVFRFPLRGGTGAIWQAIGKMLPPNNVIMNTRIVSLNAHQHIAQASDGRQWHFRKLISTIPLNHLITMTTGIVDSQIAEKLLYSSTHVVGFGMQGKPPDSVAKKCWMYFPERNSPYYRVTVFSNYSPYNVPRPGEQWSLMAEIAESPYAKLNTETLVDQTKKALIEDGLLTNPSAVITTVHRRIPQGYPTPFLGRDDIVDAALRAFENRMIFSRGRFGAWKYEVANQDHSFSQGKECAERLVRNGDKTCEPTLFESTTVNSRQNP